MRRAHKGCPYEANWRAFKAEGAHTARGWIPASAGMTDIEREWVLYQSTLSLVQRTPNTSSSRDQWVVRKVPSRRRMAVG